MSNQFDRTGAQIPSILQAIITPLLRALGLGQLFHQPALAPVRVPRDRRPARDPRMP